jgi:small conductance mechanosensitive channel
MTGSWARAIIDVGVAHQTRIDDALLALREIAATMGEDIAWKRRMLEPIDVVGVVALNDGSATLRVQVKVVAEEQWRVKNELMARIKAAFDARKIEFPGLAQIGVPRS